MTITDPPRFFPRFVDGCSHYALADLGRKYEAVVGAASISFVAGRWQGNALRFDGGPAHVEAVSRRLWCGRYGGFAFASREPGDAVWSQGKSLYVWGATWGAATEVVLADFVWRSPAGAVTPQTSLHLHADGSLSIWQGTATVQLCRSPAGAVPFDAWCYVEFRVTQDSGRVATYFDPYPPGSEGHGQVYAEVDGATVTSNPACNSSAIRGIWTSGRLNGQGWVTGPRFGNLGVPPSAGTNTLRLDVCDIFAATQQNQDPWDGTADTWRVPTVGPRRVWTVAFGADDPATAATAWPRTGAATNWQAVQTADFDTSYVQSVGFNNADPGRQDGYLPAMTGAPDMADGFCSVWLLAEPPPGVTRNATNSSEQSSWQGGDFTAHAGDLYLYDDGGTFATDYKYWCGYGNYTQHYAPFYVSGTTTMQRWTTALLGRAILRSNNDYNPCRVTQVAAELLYQPTPSPARGRTWAVWLP